jgi:hypothetical protein
VLALLANCEVWSTYEPVAHVVAVGEPCCVEGWLLLQTSRRARYLRSRERVKCCPCSALGLLPASHQPSLTLTSSLTALGHFKQKVLSIPYATTIMKVWFEMKTNIIFCRHWCERRPEQYRNDSIPSLSREYDTPMGAELDWT